MRQRLTKTLDKVATKVAQALGFASDALANPHSTRPNPRTAQRPKRAVTIGAPHPANPRYVTLTDERGLDYLFQRLQTYIFGEISRLGLDRRNADGPGYMREAGRLDPKRPYFFLKRYGDEGWLFERVGDGWTVARCEKIVGQSTFIRSSMGWDLVTLYTLKEDVNATMLPRVHSERLGGELLSFAIYEQKLIASLGIGVQNDL